MCSEKQNIHGFDRPLTAQIWLFVLCVAKIVPRAGKLGNHEKCKNTGKVCAKASTNIKCENIPRCWKPDKVKSAEIEIAVAMDCHCAIRAVVHITRIMIKLGVGSALGKMHLKRTKCTCLIKMWCNNSG